MQRCPEPWSRSFTVWLMLRHTGRNAAELSRVPVLVASSRVKPHKASGGAPLEPTTRLGLKRGIAPRGGFSSTCTSSGGDVVCDTFAPKRAGENGFPAVEYPVNMGRPKDWPSWVLAASTHASSASL
ncbi:hypothetical protein BSKO_07620 [Bryopsis sp. KO-2023]|nr:hypothetical protein BSKO_07620 [Bryopsis sp. KO-2023]